jgi:DNA recombination protein RmuC
MNYIAEVIFFLMGACLGVFGVYLLLRSKGATLTERIRNREVQLQELQSSLDKTKEEVTGLREEIKLQSDRRSAAEEKNTRIPEMESAILLKEKRLAEIQTENADLKAKLSELETRLVEERKAGEEKLKLLDEARQKLSDAFKALSSDALKSSNQSFLELARETLERYQESARTDLMTRQKAIDDLVKL